MQKPEKKNLKSPVAPPLSTQVKVILVTALVIGGVGFAFGMVSLGMIMGQQPVTNDNDTYNTYNNYTTYNTYYNTTYIYNNATGQRSIYNCCHFVISGLPQNTVSYFFNLTLQYKTVLDLFMIKNDAGEDMDGVYVRYNISIGGISEQSVRVLFYKNMGQLWYAGIESAGPDLVDWPHLLPNGSSYICQFRIEHSDTSVGDFQIILGYTVYL